MLAKNQGIRGIWPAEKDAWKNSQDDKIVEARDLVQWKEVKLQDFRDQNHLFVA